MAKAKRATPSPPPGGRSVSPRFIVALVLMVLGIAWIAYYYLAVRADPTAFPAPDAGRPGASWATSATGTT